MPSADAKAGLSRIAALLSEGKLSQAESACRAILAASPNDPAATHFLGLVRARGGDPQGGERPWPLVGGTVKRVLIDVSGEPFVDLAAITAELDIRHVRFWNQSSDTFCQIDQYAADTLCVNNNPLDLSFNHFTNL